MQPRLASLLASSVAGLVLLASGCFLFPQKPPASPCATNNGGCVTNATCSLNALNAVVCECNGGYIGNGKTECTPEVTGPCATNNGGCDTHATCTDPSGTVVCTCNSGYTGDGTSCTANGDGGGGNPCSPSPCDPNAACTDPNGTAVCTCDTDYTGNGFVCTPVSGDPCSPSPCSVNATCTTGNQGQAVCTCDQGYTGNGISCVPTNPCSPSPCGSDSQCANNGGTPVCTCDPGYVSPFGDGTDCTLITDAGVTTDAGGSGIPGSACTVNSQCETGLCLTAEGECSLAECTLPTPFPSHGSCVTRVAGQTDAGVYDGGVASRTVCNPVTNAGCTGGTFCYPDLSEQFFYCMPAGSPAGVAVCGDCTPTTATCVGGSLCLPVDTNEVAWQCAHMCCTDADCGTGNTCSQFSPALAGGVGFCVPG